MKRFLLVAVLIFPVLTLGFWIYRGANYSYQMPAPSEKKSIEDRLEQYGPSARARLKSDFEAGHISYPPARLILVGFKAEKTIQVYAAGSAQGLHFIHSYPIAAASGDAGPKLREGDNQVPEGIYSIESLNPNSRYHLSLRINYPNEFDREQARSENRTNLGGDIMIHGGSASVGCLAVGDEASEDLFVLAADTGLTNIIIILSPLDFRKGGSAPSLPTVPAWTASLYQTIKSKLDELPFPGN